MEIKKNFIKEEIISDSDNLFCFDKQINLMLSAFKLCYNEHMKKKGVCVWVNVVNLMTLK